MAKLNKIVRSDPLSRFSQVGPEAGAGFSLLSTAMETMYSRLAPAATEEMQQAGEELGRAQGEAAGGSLEVTYPDAVAGGKSSFDTVLRGEAVGASDGFPASLIETESSGRWGAYNNEVGAGGRRGHGGRLQFGAARLDDAARAGIVPRMSPAEFAKQSPEIQARVERWHFRDIDQNIERLGLNRFEGQTVSGVPITRDGIRAMAHLGGIGGAKKFLESGGKNNPSDVYGTSLRDYAARHGSGGGSVPVPSSPSVSFRNSEGKLEGKLYSPLAGPILQAHNIAAKSAYQATTLVRGQTALMELSRAFELDPEGFEREAGNVVDQIVEASDPSMRSAIRAELTEEMSRRGLGIVNAYQADVRQRASASNKALIDRYSEDYAAALATGDTDTANVMRGKLDDVLRHRQTLPGVIWTPEQSANVLRDAERSAVRQTGAARTAFEKQAKSDLDLIIKSAKAGRRSDNEEILSDPAVVAADPEKAREAAAFTALRDQRPDFLQMTPGDMLAAVEEMAAEDVSEEWQIDIVKAAGDMARENAKAWKADPVQRAADVLEVPPPDIEGAIASGDPAQIMTAMNDRADYMNDLVDRGYTPTKAFLSEGEAERMSVLLGSGADPSLRAMMAGAIVKGFGEDAVRVFEEIDGDALTMFAGKAMASGGRSSLAEEIMRGQQIMNEGVADIPSDKAVRDAFNADFQAAFLRVPGGLDAQPDIMKAARAIYAARVVGQSLDETQQTELMRESINAAMGGGRDKQNRQTGGVQPINGVSTVIPPGIAGADVEAAMIKALTGKPPHEGDGFAAGMANMGAALMGDLELDMSAFEAASPQGMPQFIGRPITRDTINGATVGLVATGGKSYMMSIEVGDHTYYATDKLGNYFVFDMDAFLEASE